MGRLAAGLCCLLLLSRCAGQEDNQSAPAHTTDTKTLSDGLVDGWKREVLEIRERRDEELKTSRTSPMAASQYLISEARETIYLTKEGDAFGLAYFPPVPDAVLMINKERDKWYWYDQGLNIVCRQDGREMPNGAPLGEYATFVIGDYCVSVRPEGRGFAFMTYDFKRPKMTSFERLHYFAADDRYRVEARLVRFPEPEEVKMRTSRNRSKTFYRYARVEFQLDGGRQELTAFKDRAAGEGSSTLFVPFRDATSGRETYGQGRYLEIEEPEEDQLVLDFNLSFSPPCNYSPVFDCPIPPDENHLQVAIRAGEKTYPR